MFSLSLLRSRIWVLFVLSIVNAGDACPIDTFKLAATTTSNQPEDWPGFLGANRDSKSTETGILKDWSNGKLETAWEATIGEGYVLGCVKDGQFFQFDAVGNECRLICRDALTGQVKWTFKYEFEYVDLYEFSEGPRATPLVDGNKVYVYGVEGMLHCVDCKTGDVIWKSNVSKSFGVVQNFFGVGSSPIIHGDSLIVMVGGSPQNEQDPPGNRLDNLTSNGTAVIVFDKNNGKVLHKFGDDLASYSSMQLYKNGTDVLGVAWLRDSVIGFDFVNGKVLWTFPFRARKYESVNASTPVVEGARIFLSESYGPGAIVLDVSKNEPMVVWKDMNRRSWALATHWNTPVLHDGYLYGCHGAGQSSSEIRCIDFATGDIKWQQKGFSRSSLTYVDGHFIVLDESGRLALIEATPNKFKEVTRYSDSKGKELPLFQPCWAAPVLANGLLYVRAKKKLICLKLRVRDAK